MSSAPIAAPHPTTRTAARPRVHGKFLWAGSEKLLVRGATYGTFRPGADGHGYDPSTIEHDFTQMAASGLNAVRLYTAPPVSVLDAAERHGLRVLVGLPWEQHVTFLDDRKRRRAIEGRLRNEVRALAGHPSLLAYAIGNEIPAAIARWHGGRRIERFLARLYAIVKNEDADGLVTYVNYPTTEYLELPFIDLVCFNVFLETRGSFEAYLARLQNIAGDRPLVLTELGLDSRRHSMPAQAAALDWQIRAAFAAGCAGAFVFAWTDAWHRGGHDVEDWDFGLVRRDRRPKPALATVRQAFAATPLPDQQPAPRISVVVCSYNGARTIGDCLEALRRLDYSDYEVIVVDDGSTDATAQIAALYVEHGFRLFRTENRGLSAARNLGLEAASGEIVAYVDDDAYPDPHWLSYLAATFASSPYAGVGGPNLPPLSDGLVAACVAASPGGPTHVLLSDREAEHIPGCNMAFRRLALREIGGFDPQFCAAGDDVDVCWRLRARGYALGFSPSAVVWHRRRGSVRAYWKQQVGYGRAEALLERKWPERYNALGHVSWSGRIYGHGLSYPLALNGKRIFHGTWGAAPFQSVYEPAPSAILALPATPEWYVLVLALGALSLLAPVWDRLWLALPLFLLAIAASVLQAAIGAASARPPRLPAGGAGRLEFRILTAVLHLLQPLARLRGRLSLGLSPWRQRPAVGLAFPVRRSFTLWSENGRPADAWLRSLEAELRALGPAVVRGGDFDRWDLTVRPGTLSGVRLLMATEEHGAGRQLVRFRLLPYVSRGGLMILAVLAGLAFFAALDSARIASGVLTLVPAAIAATMIQQSARATAVALAGLARLRAGDVR